MHCLTVGHSKRIGGFLLDYAILGVFVAYFAFMLLIGLYFYNKSKNISDYVLGGRKLNPYIAALSAQASDMSGWLLLGLPGAIFVAGLSEAWIGVGLAIGSYLAWLLVAKRLRQYSRRSGDAITIPQFISNRFKEDRGHLKFISAVIILFFFTIYVASGFVAAGNVFITIIPEIDYTAAVFISIFVIVGYTFMGGFKAVCWTDFFQAMLMIVALVVVPLAAMGHIGGWGPTEALLNNVGSGFTDMFSSTGGGPLAAIAVISSLAWGLGYFGMPHILVRYMAIEKVAEVKVARRVALVWIAFALGFACFMGLMGRGLVEAGTISVSNPENVFIAMISWLFLPGLAVIAGLFYSALMAAIMSTADSQLLVASSSVTNDLYGLKKEKTMSETNLMWISRFVVIAIAVIAAAMALDRNGEIMNLVSYAWGGFGAAFGPVILAALFWKRANKEGALAGMIAGFLTVVLWNTFLKAGGIIGKGSLCIFDTGLYELVPGFAFAFLAIIIVSLMTEEPPAEAVEEFETAGDV